MWNQFHQTVPVTVSGDTLRWSDHSSVNQTELSYDEVHRDWVLIWSSWAPWNASTLNHERQIVGPSQTHICTPQPPTHTGWNTHLTLIMKMEPRLHTHLRWVTWRYAHIYRHNYTSKQSICEWHTCSDMDTHASSCVQIHWYAEIYCQRSDSVNRTDCRWHLSPWMPCGTFFLPFTEPPPFFPFMLFVPLLLFSLQNLIGGRHTLKCFPHACRIFIQMCERGQGSSWSQLPSVYFILDELSASRRHLGSTKGGAHGDSFSADL